MPAVMPSSLLIVPTRLVLRCLQVEAWESAHMSGVEDCEVQHPLVDRVWQCSANPDDAVAFFSRLFSPYPHMRSKASFVENAIYGLHPSVWIASTMGKMQEEVGIDYWALAAPVEAERLSKGKQRCLSGFCASSFPCFGGTRQTVEAEGRVPSGLVEGDSDKWMVGSRNASAVDKSVVKEPDSAVKPSFANLRQTAWNMLKKPFVGRSKHSRQQVKKASALPSAEHGDSPGDAAKADPSAKATAADKQQVVHERAVSMTVVAGTAVEVQLQIPPEQQAVIIIVQQW